MFEELLFFTILQPRDVGPGLGVQVAPPCLSCRCEFPLLLHNCGARYEELSLDWANDSCSYYATIL